MTPDLWQRACERLAEQLPEHQFNTWIRPLPPAVLQHDAGEPAVISVRVPNRFKLDWIRAQYAGLIESVLSELATEPVRLELSLAAREATARAPAVALERRIGNGAAHAMAALKLPEPHDNGSGSAQPVDLRERAAATLPPSASRHKLNSALTFDTLVPGRANQMARTAALHVAGAPGAMYNPLFIYGGVGLGKTHLVHAVGNALLKDNPDARVLYLHAEQFISDVVKNYQRKTFDELKAKYHNLDLLLIDDVQFFAGKERTQEEFFNAFEALLAKRAHIIMTSDTYPKGLADIDERLTSRFDAGLTVAIEPPELEMRVAILIRKAEAEGAPMPEEVAFFVAKNVRANVRELEGALRKVLAYQPLQPEGHQHRAGARGAEGPAVDPEPPGVGGEHPEDGGRLLQDQDRRHVQQEAPGQHRPAAADCHVPGQGDDAEEPARDRRALRRTRPHHGAARGAQDRRRTRQEQRTEPATARAGTDAQGLKIEALVKAQHWGQLLRYRPVIHRPRPSREVAVFGSRPSRMAAHRVHPFLNP